MDRRGSVPARWKAAPSHTDGRPPLPDGGNDARIHPAGPARLAGGSASPAFHRRQHGRRHVLADAASARLWGSPHACPTRLITSDNPQDLFDNGNDLTITYGDGALPGRHATMLFEEELAPVAAPGVAELLGNALQSIRDIPVADRPTILNYERASPDWVDWRVWFQKIFRGGLEAWPVETLSTYSQSIGDAIKGRGSALGSIRLLRAELEAGTLRRVGQDVLRWAAAITSPTTIAPRCPRARGI
ncbi:MAG: hypothetical protein EOP61_39115 [Sphingomonadales bacterium]|nr:MAG: hypothetical protein EOP61_39115 [Sphingomonadales bacterium]